MTATTHVSNPRSNIRHACTDGPDGILVEVAPTTRDEAVALIARHAGAFWCSTAVGGCGQKLELPHGHINRPYFRHLAGSSECALGGPGKSTGDAYAHLAYQTALSQWLREQGYSPAFEHTFPDGGGRADLHVAVAGINHSIEVQLSPITEETWQARIEKYTRHVDATTWMFGPDRDAETYRALLADRDLAWRLKVDDGQVRVGTIGHGYEGWASLSDCTFDRTGIHSPNEDAARTASSQYRADQAAKAKATREKHEAAMRRPIDDAVRRARSREAHVETAPADTPARAPLPYAWPRPVALVLAQYPEFAEWAEGPGAQIGDSLDPQLAHLARVTAYVTCELSVSGLIENIAFSDVNADDNAAVWAHLVAMGAVQVRAITGLGTRWTRTFTFQ